MYVCIYVCMYMCRMYTSPIRFDTPGYCLVNLSSQLALYF